MDLETEIRGIENACKENITRSHSQIDQLEGKIKDLDKKMRIMDEKVAKSLDFPLLKEIKNGILQKTGDQCTLECIAGAYAVPSRTFKCSANDYCTNRRTMCLAAKSCKEIQQHFADAQDGTYTIFNQIGFLHYDVYCDMKTDGGGWALTAVVANGDSNSWTFGDADKDYGDRNALWENEITVGKVNNKTNQTPKDFKSMAFVDLPAKELMISFKGGTSYKSLIYKQCQAKEPLSEEGIA